MLALLLMSSVDGTGFYGAYGTGTYIKEEKQKSGNGVEVTEIRTSLWCFRALKFRLTCFSSLACFSNYSGPFSDGKSTCLRIVDLQCNYKSLVVSVLVFTPDCSEKNDIDSFLV
jgi:hypothetical protein